MSLRAMDQNILLSIVMERYPTVDRGIIITIIDSMTDINEFTAILKSMCDVEVDSSELLEAYEKKRSDLAKAKKDRDRITKFSASQNANFADLSFKVNSELASAVSATSLGRESNNHGSHKSHKRLNSQSSQTSPQTVNAFLNNDPVSKELAPVRIKDLELEPNYNSSRDPQPQPSKFTDSVRSNTVAKNTIPKAEILESTFYPFETLDKSSSYKQPKNRDRSFSSTSRGSNKYKNKSRKTKKDGSNKRKENTIDSSTKKPNNDFRSPTPVNDTPSSADTFSSKDDSEFKTKVSTSPHSRDLLEPSADKPFNESPVCGNSSGDGYSPNGSDAQISDTEKTEHPFSEIEMRPSSTSSSKEAQNDHFDTSSSVSSRSSHLTDVSFREKSDLTSKNGYCDDSLDGNDQTARNPREENKNYHIDTEARGPSDYESIDSYDDSRFELEAEEEEDEEEDLSNLTIPLDEYQTYKTMLKEMCPQAKFSDISIALRESDYDPARASEFLLNILAIADLDTPSENSDAFGSNQDDILKDFSNNVSFLVKSFPSMDKSVIESVLSCNDGDLLKATDDLQAIAEVSEGDTVVGDSQPSEPIDFLYSMFEDVNEDVIKKAFDDCDGDVVAATLELLSADVLKVAKEEMQLHQHFWKQEQAEAEKKAREKRQQKFHPVSGPSNSRISHRAQRDNVKFLVETYGIDMNDAKLLYENCDNDLILCCQKLEGNNYKTHNVWEYNGGRKLTTLDMKVSKVGDFKPSSSASSKKAFVPKVAKPVTSSTSASGSWTTQTNRTERSPFNTSSSSKQRTIQQLVDDEQQKRMEYIRSAAEAYRKAKANPLYGSVAGHYFSMAREHSVSNNSRLHSRFAEIVASQTLEYSIDLHHLSADYAVNSASDKLENWWTRESSMNASAPRRTIKSLRIITGAGTHSVDGIPRIKNGVRKMLVENSWNFVEHRAHFDVYGPKKNH